MFTRIASCFLRSSSFSASILFLSRSYLLRSSSCLARSRSSLDGPDDFLARIYSALFYLSAASYLAFSKAFSLSADSLANLSYSYRCFLSYLLIYSLASCSLLCLSSSSSSTLILCLSSLYLCSSLYRSYAALLSSSSRRSSARIFSILSSYALIAAWKSRSRRYYSWRSSFLILV